MNDKSEMTSHNYRLGYYLAATFIPLFLFLLSISLLIKNLNGQIDFVREELKGVRAVESIHECIVDLQKIRGITSIGLESDHYASGNGNSIAVLKEDFLRKIDRISGSHGMLIDVSSELLPLKKEAESLFAAGLGPQSFDRYTSLIREMRGLMQVAANRSNLILDPVLDTYYSANLIVNRFPELIEYIGRVRGAGGTSIISHDPRQVAELKMHLATLDNEDKEVHLVVRTILQSAPQLKSPLEPAIKEAVAALAGFVEAGRSIDVGESKGMTQYAYFDQGTRAIDAYLNVYHKVSDVLEARLIERRDHLERLRLLSISGVFLSFLLMAYFISSFYRTNRHAFERIEELSVTDALTGLYNRRQFYVIIARELQRFHRDGKSLALAILDIDHFKEYNDEYGHQAGDDVLQQVAHSMSSNLQRAGDFLFRIGGEEFCFFYGGVSVEQARTGAESVLTAIEALNIPHGRNLIGPSLTASIGMVYVHKVKDQNYSILLKKADEALYEAKSRGRNRCCVVE